MSAKVHARFTAATGGLVPFITSVTATPTVLEYPRYPKYHDTPPWALTTLHVVAHGRVIVAASGAESSWLHGTLAIAERAAAAADQYARWGRPAVYVLYLASASEFRRWFDNGLYPSLGVAFTLAENDVEVTVAMPLAAGPSAGPGRLAAVVQHEFGHVATLQGIDPLDASRYSHADHDTLVEGIAEYCAYTGHAGWAAGRLADVGAYLRTGKWSGKAFLTKELDSKSVLTVSAAYGIGYLAIRRLVQKYGLAVTLDFWAAAEHGSGTPESAAQSVLHTSWAKVDADIAAYIHKTVHA
jgi:hypothetical protein